MHPTSSFQATVVAASAGQSALQSLAGAAPRPGRNEAFEAALNSAIEQLKTAQSALADQRLAERKLAERRSGDPDPAIPDAGTAKPDDEKPSVATALRTVDDDYGDDADCGRPASDPPAAEAGSETSDDAASTAQASGPDDAAQSDCACEGEDDGDGEAGHSDHDRGAESHTPSVLWALQTIAAPAAAQHSQALNANPNIADADGTSALATETSADSGGTAANPDQDAGATDPRAAQAKAAASGHLPETRPGTAAIPEPAVAATDAGADDQALLATLARAPQTAPVRGRAGTNVAADPATGSNPPPHSANAARSGAQAPTIAELALTAATDPSHTSLIDGQTALLATDTGDAALATGGEATGLMLPAQDGTESVPADAANPARVLNTNAGATDPVKAAGLMARAADEALPRPEGIDQALAAVSGNAASASASASNAAATQAARNPIILHSPIGDVAVHIARAANEGADRIQIQLDPAELGRIDVRLEVGHDGRVIAVVSAERQETLDLLQRDARTLERALQEAGLRTDSNSLNFNLQGGSQGRDHEMRDMLRQMAGDGSGSILDQTADATTAAAMARYQTAATGHLDLRV